LYRQGLAHHGFAVVHVLVGLLVLGLPDAGDARAESVPVTLAQLEERALASNPTLPQAEAVIRMAAGQALQAGLYPNPTMGYMGEELRLGAVPKRSEHRFFIQQPIVTAGKLGESRRVLLEAENETKADAERQKLRVLNAVRVQYYEVLGAQEMVRLRSGLVEIARDADRTSQELENVGAADRPDVLEAQIEVQQAEIALTRANNQSERAWQVLAALVGDPSMERAEVQGDLQADWPRLDREALLETLLRESPEIHRASAGVDRARAGVERARSEPVPDVILRGGIGYNSELADLEGRKVGPEAFIEAGVRVPLFDRNQGNIASAKADVLRAESEARRLALELRVRLAAVFNRYQDALGIAERYRNEVIPRAQEAHELYLARFREMGAAYPQVLIAQRTLVQVQVEYVQALVDLWQESVVLQGMLVSGGLEPPVPETAPMSPGPGADSRISRPRSESP
jgi:outer membrane protein, heavy metal efflux system